MTDTKLPFNISGLHTTPLGEMRLRRNLGLDESCDAVGFCRRLISDEAAEVERRGKNWYVTTGRIRITVNARSLTIITAHRI